MFVPKGACWLNLREAWWRIFRRQALAGQTFADPEEIAYATAVATTQPNTRSPPLDLGPSGSRASSPPTPFCPPALRNVSLGVLLGVGSLGGGLPQHPLHEFPGLVQ